MKNANAQNNTFASTNTQADASACIRFVFLPTHPSPPTTLENSLTSIMDNRMINDLKNVFLEIKI
ncbi:MAG: hypothetical protein PHF92_10680 [Bacteroidales bacterium]|nr:hypothetical protein [Bacteroidales bacterium]